MSVVSSCTQMTSMKGLKALLTGENLAVVDFYVLTDIGGLPWWWLRIRLPMQGTRVQSLVQEDPTCRGSTKPMCHNY